MNKIFKSVNAKNLDDVLYDVNYIKHNFNQLKNRITEVNQDITNLNNEYNKLCIQLDNIKKEISNEEQKKKLTYKREDRNRVEEINQELKKLNVKTLMKNFLPLLLVHLFSIVDLFY